MVDLMSTNQILGKLSDGGLAKMLWAGKVDLFYEHISISGKTNDCPIPTWG